MLVTLSFNLFMVFIFNCLFNQHNDKELTKMKECLEKQAMIQKKELIKAAKQQESKAKLSDKNLKAKTDALEKALEEIRLLKQQPAHTSAAVAAPPPAIADTEVKEERPSRGRAPKRRQAQRSDSHESNSRDKRRRSHSRSRERRHRSRSRSDSRDKRRRSHSRSRERRHRSRSRSDSRDKRRR
jgi:type IV secretory pathway VirB10-like protein